jgi:hypothetical protein
MAGSNGTILRSAVHAQSGRRRNSEMHLPTMRAIQRGENQFEDIDYPEFP